MGLRDGQRRVEHRPGAFVWMTDEDADSFERARKSSPVVETATAPEPEQAVMPSKPRKSRTPSPAHEPKS